MKRYLLMWFIALPILLVLMPAALVFWFSPEIGPVSQPTVAVTEPAIPAMKESASSMPVKVYRTEKKAVETLPLETYITGVVAAEMPAEFELEALKAQALAARTYIVRRVKEGKFDDVPSGGQVLDTVQHQVYMDEHQRRERWGDQYEWKNKRIQQAVMATAGIILTYQNEPIDATFFSTSNGFTENSDEYWEKPIPYLKSVASPWDIQSPRYEETVVMSTVELEKNLGVKLTQEASTNGSWYRIESRTTGNRVGTISIGGKEFTGREFREKLNLNSSSFTLDLRGNQVFITTKGYGHGVGMSQWGANGMAKSGKSAEQIVKHFYQGISLQVYSRVIPA
ncbi:stage II sporulation protein D [Brevibacillus sp. HB1.2]|uniref:stage II sporulation protein D n=1 Tax=unclassified Brevibacillus TaxID=2684853 RepID=UPI000363AD27|nr:MULTISPECIES: stage II sporulation protein D [unclassified Brevibacillus]ATF15983.1 stage II sporulation protein D [Brevibacillus brevis X23]MDC0761620.1 stage II sporulation protein D [Brevibacillus sp. AG]NTU21731.1 stage II sporulation protein D [Brevibacillus sp. HB1.2]NTU31118.1 stage II sporulation protein D [Brevibacillus sp. HB1.1]